MLRIFNCAIALILISLSCFLLPCQAESDPETDLSRWSESGAGLRSFRIVIFDKNDNKIYAGGVNKIYKFNPANVTEKPTVAEWSPSPAKTNTCLRFKSDPMLCQNNIGVLTSFNATHLYACGTMAFSPSCCFIVKETMSIEDVESSLAKIQFKSPYNPYVSTVSVVANETLFTATQVGMHGKDGIISKSFNGYALRTEREDKYWLYDPTFVGGLLGRSENPSHDKVYLFFREKSEEFQPYMYGMASNPDTRNIVSRVASVCVNDHGGSAWVLNRKFATYTKMSIVCNSEGNGVDAPFRYQHLESTFVMENPEDPKNPTIYGLFTMPNNAIAGSAVCSYKMSDIKHAMKTNEYWTRNMNDGVKTTFDKKGISAPGECNVETQRLPQFRLMFGENHPIKFGDIFPSKDLPSYQQSGTRYWRVVVDKISGDKNSFGKNATVIYMITAKGVLKRVVHAPSVSPTPWSLPEIKVAKLAEKEIVIDMLLGDRYLYVVTNSSLIQMPLDYCSYYAKCSQCKEARDPYCTQTTSGLCSSVYGLSQESLRDFAKSDFKCPYVPVRKSPETILIEQLRANLSDLQLQNEEARTNVSILLNTQRRNQETLGSCNNRLEAQNAAVASYRQELHSAVEHERELKESRKFTEEELAECRSNKSRALSENVRLVMELKERHESYVYVEKHMHRAEVARDEAKVILNECKADLKQEIHDKNACSRTLTQVKDELRSINDTCSREKRSIADTLNLEIETMRNKLANERNRTKHKIRKREEDIASMKKQLRICYGVTDKLNRVLLDLQKSNKHHSLKMSTMRHRNKRDARLIKQLQWLHKQNGYRGQQSCNHNGWFLSNTSGSLFLLSKKRGNFQNAEKICKNMNAQLAVFNDPAEIKYVNTIIKAFEPTRHYWIGLVKHSNGTFLWNDGTRLDGYSQRFYKRQTFRIRKKETYCVEATSFKRWYLTPCNRLRRPICQKVLHPSVQNNPHIVSNFIKIIP